VANHKSAEKRARQTIKKTAHNKSRESGVKSIIKKIRSVMASGEKAEVAKLLPEAQSLISRLAKTGVIKKEAAARKISRLASQANKL
jgi:small subunit ribosomal protein S20